MATPLSLNLQRVQRATVKREQRRALGRDLAVHGHRAGEHGGAGVDHAVWRATPLTAGLREQSPASPTSDDQPPSVDLQSPAELCAHVVGAHAQAAQDLDG
jgi:hypothetical protein